MNISAVIVTRGDVDLSAVLDALPREWEKSVWDNSQREDLGVYGRYAAIDDCEHELIYVQDDDCVLEPEAFAILLDAYEPGHLATNMPERFRPHYPDSALVGFGAIFDRDLPDQAFADFFWGDRDTNLCIPSHPFSDFVRSDVPAWQPVGSQMFNRECDSVFTALTPRILIDAPYRDLPWASAPNRLWKQPEHVGERRRMLELARKVRDA